MIDHFSWRRYTAAMSKQSHDIYENPLVSRYASPQMLKVFSPQFKFGWWRRLWLALAESQKELGLQNKPNNIIQSYLSRCTYNQLDIKKLKNGNRIFYESIKDQDTDYKHNKIETNISDTILENEYQNILKRIQNVKNC